MYAWRGTRISWAWVTKCVVGIDRTSRLSFIRNALTIELPMNSEVPAPVKITVFSVVPVSPEPRRKSETSRCLSLRVSTVFFHASGCWAISPGVCWMPCLSFSAPGSVRSRWNAFTGFPHEVNDVLVR